MLSLMYLAIHRSHSYTFYKEDTHQESSDCVFGSLGFHDVFSVWLCYDWYFPIWSSNMVVCFYKGKKNICSDILYKKVCQWIPRHF